MVVTAYCPCKLCCGAHAAGITASGQSVYSNGMKMVAADRALLPFGTLVSVPGYHAGVPVPVLDRGGAIKGDRLDILLPTHEQALAWGRRTLEVTIWRDAQP
jgi:3D (Asp-Asp-Asp) domain-containing protein